jgi:hypothetical protein
MQVSISFMKQWYVSAVLWLAGSTNAYCWLLGSTCAFKMKLVGTQYINMLRCGRWQAIHMLGCGRWH